MGHRLQALASLPWKRLGCFRILAIAATSVVALAAGPSLISGADGKPPLLQPRASISGRILGVDGQPLPGVKVVLYAPRYGGNEEVLATAATDALGRFSFKGLRAWGYNILVFPKDRAIIGRGVNIDAGEQLTLSDMRLEPAFPAAIVVRDPDGKPLAGAHARSLKWSGPAGAAYRVTAFDLSQRLGIPTFVSGTDGRLVLLPLPAGTRLTGIVAHPNFAPAAFDIEVRERSAPPSVKLTKGGFIRIHLSPPERVARLERVQVLSSLRSSALGTPSPTHYTFENLPIEGDQLVLPVEPGLLTYLYLDHPKFTIVPQMSDGDPSESYLIPAGATQEFRMTVYPKVVFSARLLDRETRKPFGSNDVVIWGYVADPGRAAIDERVGPGWAFAGSTRAAENGDFSLPLTAGRARLRLQPRNSIVEPEFVDLDVRPDDQRRVISVGSRPIPAITGTVVDSKGGPVRSAIVRLHKQFRGLPAVVTDGTGRFRFQLPFLPVRAGADTDSSVTVAAFDPLRPLSARRCLKFDRNTRAADVQDLRLSLALEPLDAVVDTVSIEDPAIRSSEEPRRSLIGMRAPELDCQAWLNDSGNPNGRKLHTLADFRGKYVLLDFWSTGCGPCHYDFPKIKLLRDLYRDRNFVVVGVHNNSADLQSIRAHVAKEKIDFLIAVDHPDGRTLRAYDQFLVFGLPCYVLIDPNGVVLKTSADAGEPRIRADMFEIVREHVLGGERR